MKSASACWQRGRLTKHLTGDGEQLAHVLRAAAQIAGDGHILVIGSQAVLGTYTEAQLPERATMSMEADIAFLDGDVDKSDIVEGTIGEGSQFHQTFGYYPQGVSLDTPVLPGGWKARAIDFKQGDVGQAEAVCLEVHDLVVSKLIAGREKDYEYASAFVAADLVSVTTLIERWMTAMCFQSIAGASTNSFYAFRPEVTRSTDRRHN